MLPSHISIAHVEPGTVYEHLLDAFAHWASQASTLAEYRAKMQPMLQLGTAHGEMPPTEVR